MEIPMALKPGEIGRHLLPTERVHHKNGKRQDNRPENLELWQGAGKKDPPGIRVVDSVLHALESLTQEELDRIACRAALVARTKQNFVYDEAGKLPSTLSSEDKAWNEQQRQKKV